MRHISICLTLAIFLLLPSMLFAQEQQDQAKSTESRSQSLLPKTLPAGFRVENPLTEAEALESAKIRSKEERAEIAEQIRVAEKQLQQQQEENKQEGEKPADAAMGTEEEARLRSLKQLEVIMAQGDQQIKKLEDTRKELAARKTELQEVQDGKIGLEKPYSFLSLDQLQDELASLESRLSSSQLNRDLINADIAEAKVQQQQKEQAWRQGRESGDVVADSEKNDTSKPGLELRLAQQTLDYRKRRLEIQNLQSEIDSVRVQIVQQKLSIVREEVVFSEADLKSKKDELQKKEDELRVRLKRLEARMEESDTRWLTDRAANVQDLTPLDAEQLELRRLERQLLQAQVASQNYRLELNNQARETWDRRYQFANELSTQERNIEVENEAKAHLKQRDRDFSSRMLQQDELRKTVAALESELESFADDENGRQLRQVVQSQRTAVRNKMIVVDEDVAAIQANRRIIEKLLADIQGDANRYAFATLAQNAWYHTKRIWNTELTNVDDRSITIGKVIQALLIFIGGFFIARWLSRWLANFMKRRLRVDESAAAAFQSLGFYGLLLMFLLGSLNFVSIPLTVFTFLGGALAIGVGFGSQNILSNFISGLILLAERPVKVGDLIKMDEFFGNVETIGARSTVVRTGTNLKLIIPNSKFLETNVVNFTHGANDTIRTCIEVGVAYGSSTRDTTRLLKQAANDHGLVLKNPEPFVLFKSFGDNSLIFELHFWINVNRPLDRLRMESDLRYRIESLFNDAGVVIAFPQRDVHLNATGPLDIRMLTDQTNEEPPARTDAA